MGAVEAGVYLTLSSVAAQTLGELRVVVADQSRVPARESPVVQTLLRVIEARGGRVEWRDRPQIHGVAELFDGKSRAGV